MRYIIIVFLAVSGFFAHSQELQGTWVSVARLDISNDNDSSTQASSLDSLLEFQEADSAYFVQFGLIADFMKDGSLVLGGIGGELKNGNHKLVADTIIIEVDTMSLAGILKSGQLL
ncbi:MAG: hypothetical protein RIC80_17180, partial [Cyclobacteriaceae bacterium]